MNKIITFLKEVQVEMTKVTWPTQRQVVNYTFMVIVVCAFLAVYLGGLDLIYKYLLNTVILK